MLNSDSMLQQKKKVKKNKNRIENYASVVLSIIFTGLKYFRTKK